MGDYKQLQDLTPLDVIFSCAVCQATVKGIYADAQDNSGLRIDPDSEKGVVVKLWLTECGHLTCGEHLEGGGAPFHPAGQPPHAPCPICSAEAGIIEPRALYAVYGTEEGQYDPKIPRNYFETPPIRLHGNAPGKDALRFQYLSLLRYGTRILHKLKQVEQEKVALQIAKDKEATNSEIMKQRLLTLEGRARELEVKEEKLKSWEKREPTIKHYLHILNSLVKENEMLKQQLSFLGYTVPATKYAMNLADKNDLSKPSTHIDTVGMDHAVTDGHEESFVERAHLGPKAPTMTPLVRDWRAPTFAGRASGEQQESSSSGMKRKLDDVLGAIADPLERRDRSSRDMMPPPQRPGGTTSLSPYKPSDSNRVQYSVPNKSQWTSPQKPICQGQEAQGGLDKPYSEGLKMASADPNSLMLSNGVNSPRPVENEAPQYTMRDLHGLGNCARQSIQQDWHYPERPYPCFPSWSSSETGPQHSSHAQQPMVNTRDVHKSPLPWPRNGVRGPIMVSPYAGEARGVEVRQQADAYGTVSTQSPGPHRISLLSPLATRSRIGSPSRFGSYAQMDQRDGLMQQRQAMGPPATIPHSNLLASLSPDRSLRTPVQGAYPLRSRLSTESVRNNLSDPTTPLRGGFPSIRKHERPPGLRREPVSESVTSPFFKSHGPRSAERLGTTNDLRGQTAKNVMQGWRMGPTTGSSTTLPSLNGLSFITDPRTVPKDQLPNRKPVVDGNRGSHFFAPSTPPPNGFHHSGGVSTVYTQPNGAAYHHPRTFSQRQSNGANIFSRQVQPLPSSMPSITSSLGASHASRPPFSRDDGTLRVGRGGDGGTQKRQIESIGPQRRGNESTRGQGFLQRIDNDQYRSGSRNSFAAVNGRRSVRR
ncbi:MAG: hypothetical protein M1835_002644 [Candelina submexicana]|nr:MAG: hypothetical protein M1835_002644 [Candelina submexicana]